MLLASVQPAHGFRPGSSDATRRPFVPVVACRWLSEPSWCTSLRVPFILTYGASWSSCQRDPPETRPSFDSATLFWFCQVIPVLGSDRRWRFASPGTPDLNRQAPACPGVSDCPVRVWLLPLQEKESESVSVRLRLAARTRSVIGVMRTSAQRSALIPCFIRSPTRVVVGSLRRGPSVRPSSLEGADGRTSPPHNLMVPCEPGDRRASGSQLLAGGQKKFRPSHATIPHLVRAGLLTGGLAKIRATVSDRPEVKHGHAEDGQTREAELPDPNCC